MEVKEIGTGTSVAAGATVTNDTSPFAAGMRVLVMAHSKGAAFSGSAKLQESDDGTTWSDIAGAVAADAGVDFFNITLKKFIRINTTAFTSGSISFSLLG